MQYFARSGNIQPDGRVFDERTLQAVNKTAANVTSYRELVAAFANASSGTVITITEKIVVRETIVFSIPDLTIRCSGRGALLPERSGMTLFRLENIGGCVFDEVVVDQNDVFEFDLFVLFIQSKYTDDSTPKDLQDLRNIIIRYCTVVATTFIKTSTNNGVKILKLQDPAVDDQSVWIWSPLRSFLVNNKHTSIITPSLYDGVRYRKEGCSFVEGIGGFVCWTVTGNSSDGYILFQGSGTVINNNTKYGSLTAAGSDASIFINPTSQRNVVTSNLTGALPNTFEPNNLLANNLDLP